MILRNFKYDVTLSFAEENHAFVEGVAMHLKSRNVDYYYYKEDLIKIWGKELKKHLSGIYNRQSRLCVIFISSHYKEKVWTQFELKHAWRRAKRDIQEYILPFKLDATELPEISPTIKYLSVNELNEKELADAICEKIEEHKRKDAFIYWPYRLVRYYLSSRRNVIVATISAISIFGLSFRDHLTPIDTLTMRLYERSKKTIKGSICRDGWFSKSRGSGSCSSHQGVLTKKDSIVPAKTMKECRDEAKEISWLPE